MLAAVSRPPSVHPPVHPSVRLSVCLSLYLFIHRSSSSSLPPRPICEILDRSTALRSSYILIPSGATSKIFILLVSSIARLLVVFSPPYSHHPASTNTHHAMASDRTDVVTEPMCVSQPRRSEVGVRRSQAKIERVQDNT